MLLNAQQVYLLFQRLGFGADYPTIKSNIGKTAEAIFYQYAAFDAPLQLSFEPIALSEMQSLSEEEKEALKKTARQGVIDLNLLWLEKMSASKAPFREKMALFWHGHFACEDKNPVFVQNYCNVLRENAFGNFRDLVFYIAKDAAMLRYLNNQQNRKKQPNENFARELMELFTLGRGNYTEKDVQEAARGFTGWSFEPGTGDFIKRENLHDNNEKVFFDKHGNLDGDDIINTILDKKECAYFIAKKFLKYFLSEHPDPTLVSEYGAELFNNGYDMEKLTLKLISSEVFYRKENRFQKIKSPIELIAQINRLIPITYDQPKIQLAVQRGLGQILFHPPNVAGWKGGNNWIDSSTMTFRFYLPQFLWGTQIANFSSKESGDDNDPFQLSDLSQNKATPDWDAFAKNIAANDKIGIIREISEWFLGYPIDPQKISFFITASDKKSICQSVAERIIQLPEFQLS